MTNAGIMTMTIPQLKVALTNLGVSFKSKNKKAELQEALINAAVKPQSESTMETWETEQKPVMITHDEAHDGFTGVMGLHYRGKALGLKHYQAMGLANRPSTLELSREHTHAHLPNSERVQKYEMFNTLKRDGLNRTNFNKRAKLTPKQMRRVRKNANKHGEGFMYGNAVDWARTNGYSVLARTPEGLGIFYKFSN